MKVVIQRVSRASVSINKQPHSIIAGGLLILIGIAHNDTLTDADWLCEKIVNLRIFADENGLMNKSVVDVNGDLMLVSQFTLIASYKKGNRPSFIQASKPDVAEPIYQYCINKLESLLGKHIATGVFGADMQIDLQNDGPVTIVMDTHNKE